MDEEVEVVQTGRACLEEICKLVPDAGNPDALMGDSPVESPEQVQAVLSALRLKPEWREDVSPDELATHFGSPVMLQLGNENWVIFLGCRRGAEGHPEYP